MQMDPNDWERAKELFEAALELEPSERASFLAGNCHEVSLQQQVENLLINYQAAGSFLDEPAWHSAAKSAETEDPMVNRRLGAYKLVRRLGQGGMAAVFLAVRADDEYHMEVAIKLVQPGFDSQDVMTRFRNERQTLAALDHPNVVRLLDGGSTPEGWPFLVMEYVEGRPIDEYCDQHRLSVDDRLRLFGKVCDAVQYAHQKLVIHRDLKPSNILVVADGTPKLLDFGIAKVLNPETSTQGWLATHTSLRCMTPAYASPEQARGKSVTSQTDVYSLGVVLYELLTGHRPYRLTQHSPAEIERAICEQEPETPSTAISRVENDTSPDGKPITKTPELVSLTREGQPDKLRRRLRGDLDNIVLKALQKEPQQRYGSVAEFSQDIDRHLQRQPVKARPSTIGYRVSKFVQRHKGGVSAAFAVLIGIAAAASFAFNAVRLRDPLARDSSPARIQSIAVIPLVNISGDPAQEYFSDGITDSLITNLAEVGSLKVISRTSTVQYKQSKKPLPEIARELNVDGIVEGTVQRSGDRVRVDVQLIHGPTNKHLWAKSYDRELKDVSALQMDVANDIADQVQARLTTPEQHPLAPPKPVDPEVLDAYLQGNHYLAKANKGPKDDNLRKAAEYFQRAIDADPSFAAAYIGLAEAHNLLWWPSNDDLEIMKVSAEKAVELDPESSDAHEKLGEARELDFDWAGAEEEHRRAIALNPSNALAHECLGQELDTLGKLDEGWKEQEIAQLLDPKGDHLSGALQRRGQYDRAIDLLRRMSEREPDDAFAHYFLSVAYAGKGLYQEWVDELGRGLTLLGLPEMSAHLHRAFEESGQRGALRQLARELESLVANRQGYFPGVLAHTYAALGDKDRAFYWLQEGCNHHRGAEPELQFVKVEPAFAPLRTDPRFKEVLDCMRLPP